MQIVILGAGFAGMYAALAAARLREANGVLPRDLEIALVGAGTAAGYPTEVV